MKETLTYDTGPIRPPSEARSLLLRVSRNCSWNRCRFCTTYKGASFETRSVQEVREDIDNMARIADMLAEETKRHGVDGRITPTVMAMLNKLGVSMDHAYQVALFLGTGAQNVFLQDGNSLEIPTEEMAEILRYLYLRFPTVKRVTTYARSMTLARLGADALTELRSAGLTRVHVGLESGNDEVLKRIRKGVLAKQHIEGGQAAKKAGLELSEYVMPGIGGKELTALHARDTAIVLNAIDPHFIRLRSFYPLPGSGMAQDLKEGTMTLLDEDGVVAEIRAMIEGLDGIESRLVSDHDRNLLMEVEGRFPQDKAMMLGTLDEYLGMPEDSRQLFRIGRRLGYFHVLSDLEIASSRKAAEEAVKELKETYGDADRGLEMTMVVRM